jgi:glycosyltransferase involved in cell wall biosynthesis
MKLVFIAPFAFSPKATVSARMLPMATSLVQRGHHVTILIPPYDNPAHSDVKWSHEGVLIENAHVQPHRPGGSIDLLSQASQLANRTNRLHADIVHVFKPVGPGALAMWLMQFRMRHRVVVDNDDWEGRGGWLDVNHYPAGQKLVMAWQERWCLGHAGAITCASQVLQTRSQSMAVNNALPVMLPNGPQSTVKEQVSVAQSHREELRARYGWGSLPVVIYAGTVPLNHDLDIAVSAMRSALVRHPGLRWVVIATGDGLTSLRSAVAQADIESSIEFHDFMPHSQLIEYLVAADIAIYPYRDTNINRAKCSGKVIDYMASGLPIVVSDVGMNRYYLDQGRCGLLTEPGNAAAFTEALERLLDSFELRQQLGQSAQKRLWEVFRWDERVTELVKLYTCLINS